VDIVLQNPSSPQTITLHPDDTGVVFNSITVQGGSYTLQGPAKNARQALVLVAGASLDTQNGSSLAIGPDPLSSPDANSLSLKFLGSTTKTGAGILVLNNDTVLYAVHQPTLQPFHISGGTVTLGASVDMDQSLLEVDAPTRLVVSDKFMPTVGSLTGSPTGSGTIQIGVNPGQTAHTGLTIFTPQGESDVFNGVITGQGGTIIYTGLGSITLGDINASNSGLFNVSVSSGSLVVNGVLNAQQLLVVQGLSPGSLLVNGVLNAQNLIVNSGATFGGLATMNFSGPVQFASGATFAAVSNGTAPGQFTKLTDTDSSDANPVNLGGSTLALSLGNTYIPAWNDTFTLISSAHGITGHFANVANNGIVFANGFPFQVNYNSTSVTVKALLLTTTQLQSSPNPSNPGQGVTFTAKVTVTGNGSPVIAGFVSFFEGPLSNLTLLAGPVPVNPGTGTAVSPSITSLALGSDPIWAAFSGVPGAYGPSAANLTQTVAVAQPTVTNLFISAPSFFVGQQILLAAAVQSGGAPVTEGSVNFATTTGIFLGNSPVGANGVAFVVTTALPAGSYSFIAAYIPPPGSRFLASPSNSVTATVNLYPTSTALILTSQRQRRRTRFFLNASVSSPTPGSPPISGMVAFERNGTVIGGVALVGGRARLFIGTSRPRSVSFTAIFQANGTFDTSTSNTLSF
jgi:hypothetical protein